MVRELLLNSMGKPDFSAVNIISVLLNLITIMNRNKDKIKASILSNNVKTLNDILRSVEDINFGNGWPIRLAARYGLHSVVKIFIQYGASVHTLSEAGASTLQLAVFSGLHWDTDGWIDLLSCCDSSQLAEGAAVAIIFNNIAALTKILQTGRCNTNMPTFLSGKSVEELAKGYKLQYLLNIPVFQNNPEATPNSSSRESRTATRKNHLSAHRNLSPSVAHFFDLTANQPSLTPPHSPLRQFSSAAPQHS